MFRVKRLPGGVSQIDRVLSKVRFGRGCWKWCGALNSAGYGVFKGADKKNYYAHRWVWERASGKKIKKGLQLDHLCKNPSCVRPAHLQPVTPMVNNSRGNSPTSINARATSCVNGHPFDLKNTYIRLDGAGRVCRRCRADRIARVRSCGSLGASRELTQGAQGLERGRSQKYNAPAHRNGRAKR